jgi:hypothetical protein
VQATGDLVAVVVEFAARVQDRQHDLGRRLPARVPIDRDAATVVDDGDRPVDVDGDVDLIAEAREGLVNGVVDDLVHEVMKPGRAGRPDVHRGALPDGFETFEDLDLVGGVVVDVGRSAMAVVALGRIRSQRFLAIAIFGSACVFFHHTRMGMITYV